MVDLVSSFVILWLPMDSQFLHSNQKSKTFLVLMDCLLRIGFRENILNFLHCSFPQTGRKIFLTENDVFLSVS